MDDNPYQSPLAPYQPPLAVSESPLRTDLTFIEGLAYFLGQIAVGIVGFFLFAALALGVLALAVWLQ